MYKNSLILILSIIFSLQCTLLHADSNDDENNTSGSKDNNKVKNKNKCKRKLRIEEENNLKFGTLVAESSGTVILNTNDSRTATGGIVLIGSLSQAARFEVKGCRNESYSILLPPSATLVSGSNSMLLDSFSSSASINGVLSQSGKQEFSVGGTLHLIGNQPAGYYSGSFEVEVAYQ